jgi:hypothetical protein
MVTAAASAATPKPNLPTIRADELARAIPAPPLLENDAFISELLYKTFSLPEAEPSASKKRKEKFRIST